MWGGRRWQKNSFCKGTCAEHVGLTELFLGAAEMQDAGYCGAKEPELRSTLDGSLRSLGFPFILKHPFPVNTGQP